MTRKLLTPKEVSAMLGVATKTLATWRYTKRYPLSYVKVGRRVLYKNEDVQNFIENRRVEQCKTA